MNFDHLRETFLSKEEIFNGHIIKAELWQVRLPDGHTAPREIIVHPGAAAVVPVDEKGRVTMVRQHRVAIDTLTSEIPAGKLDKGNEDPLDCARRELEEETGLQAKHWQKLTCIATTPGFATERISIYLATGLHRTRAHTDEDEFVDTFTLPLEEAVTRCLDGTFTDAKTIVGLMMARAVLEKQSASPSPVSTI